MKILEHKPVLLYLCIVVLAIVGLLSTGIVLVYPFSVLAFIAISSAVLQYYVNVKKSEKKESKINKKAKVQNETKTYIAPQQAPTFVNRRSEQEQLMDSVKNKKMILIRGVAGIGKTELAVKIWENLKNKNCKTFWRDIYSTDFFITIIRDLANFFCNNGYSKLYEYIEEKKGNDFSEIANYIIEALNSNKYILFFDDYHKLNPKTNDRDISVKKEMDELLAKLAHNLKNSTIVIIAREIPDFISKIDNKQKILDVNLEGFDSLTISEYLSKKKLQLKPEQFSKIEKFIQHPWTLSYFANANNAEQKDTSDVIEFFKSDEYKEYLMKHVSSGLSDIQQEILNVMSLFRTPVDSDALNQIINKDVLEDILLLKNKELIKKKNKGYDLHDLLKEFCYKKIIRSKKKSLHKSIGEYYMSLDITPENFLEASYHLIKNYGVINNDVIEYFLKAPNDKIYYIFVINEILKDDSNRMRLSEK